MTDVGGEGTIHLYKEVQSEQKLKVYLPQVPPGPVLRFRFTGR